MMPKNDSSRPSHCRSHDRVTCSSSVAPGDDFQSIAFTFTAEQRNSASMEGGEDETEKYAMNRGWFHSVRAGKTVFWKSAKILSIDSLCSGAASGSVATSSPGLRAVVTG